MKSFKLSTKHFDNIQKINKRLKEESKKDKMKTGKKRLKDSCHDVLPGMLNKMGCMPFGQTS